LIQAAYLFHTSIVFTKTDFLASVLPGVLATLANEDRAQNGVDALTSDAHLAQAAQMKADDMAAKGYFAHVDPEGRAPWYWLDKAGYSYSYAGENLAVNFNDSEDVETAWMNSPTHRANIVKQQYTRIGIGTATGMYEGKETTFVVQFFATPKAVAAPPREATPAATELAEATPAAVPAIETETAEEVPVPAIAASEPSEDTRVLGTETQSGIQAAGAQAPASKVSSFFAQVATSPNHTVAYVLGTLFVLFALLLLAAVTMHAKVQYLEVIGGGLAILLVAFSLMAYDALSVANVQIPQGAQPAAAIEAL
jgi:hypothetical protein